MGGKKQLGRLGTGAGVDFSLTLKCGVIEAGWEGRNITKWAGVGKIFVLARGQRELGSQKTIHKAKQALWPFTATVKDLGTNSRTRHRYNNIQSTSVPKDYAVCKEEHARSSSHRIQICARHAVSRPAAHGGDSFRPNVLLEVQTKP
jgi:hypothetical protein